MNRQEFECDTPDCRFWDEEDGCTHKASITIQEHCCCDFEKKPVDKIVIEVRGGMVQSVHTTLGVEMDVEVIDLDQAAVNGDDPDALCNARESIEHAEAVLRQIY